MLFGFDPEGMALRKRGHLCPFAKLFPFSGAREARPGAGDRKKKFKASSNHFRDELDSLSQ